MGDQKVSESQPQQEVAEDKYGRVIAHIRPYLMGPEESPVQFTDLQLRKIIYDHHVVDGLALEYIIVFLRQAQLTKADPERKQIYLTKRWDSKKDHNVGVVVWSYHWMLDRANATGELTASAIKSCQVETIFDPLQSKEIQTLVARTVVGRRGRFEVEYPAIYEYCVELDFKTKQPKGFWRNNPYHQLIKTSLANGLRLQFPEILSGCYIEGELRGEDPVIAGDKDKDALREIQGKALAAPSAAPISTFGVENMAHAPMLEVRV